jgi:predicted nuclease of predicted toxin-antitoxin system
VSHLKAVLQNVSNSNTANLLGHELRDIQKYLNEEHNPSIKRYRMVVSEYYKKYSQELSI